MYHLPKVQLSKPLCACVTSVIRVRRTYVIPLCACIRHSLKAGCAILRPSLSLHTVFTRLIHVSSNKLLSGFVASFELPSHSHQVISEPSWKKLAAGGWALKLIPLSLLQPVSLLPLLCVISPKPHATHARSRGQIRDTIPVWYSQTMSPNLSLLSHFFQVLLTMMRKAINTVSFGREERSVIAKEGQVSETCCLHFTVRKMAIWWQLIKFCILCLFMNALYLSVNMC